jgi:hypothetical protein
VATRMVTDGSGLGRGMVTESRMDRFSNSHLNDTNPVVITKRLGGSSSLQTNPTKRRPSLAPFSKDPHKPRPISSLFLKANKPQPSPPPSSSRPQGSPLKMSSSDLDQLIEMGFEKERAELSLQKERSCTLIPQVASS